MSSGELASPKFETPYWISSAECWALKQYTHCQQNQTHTSWIYAYFAHIYTHMYIYVTIITNEKEAISWLGHWWRWKEGN